MSTFTEMWATRPPRIPSEQGGHGHIAGVCEGIAIRYRVDPTLIRVIFVVFAFFGGGIAAYLAAWLIMPRYSVPVAPVQALFQDRHPKERTQGWWLLIFFIIFSGVLGAGISDLLGSATLLALGLAGLGWWALHKKEPIPPAGLLAVQPSPSVQEHTMSQRPEPDLSGITPAEGYSYPPGRTTPPSWDPLGAAPFAWDLPDPTTPPQPPKRKAKVWPWVVLGTGSVFAVGLLTLGLFVSGGLLLFADDYDGGAIGETSFAPTTEGQLQASYNAGIGETTVDFRELGPLESSQEVRVDGGVGELEIYLPANVPVELNCESGLGETNCTPGSYNEDAEGEMLQLRIDSGIGETVIHLP